MLYHIHEPDKELLEHLPQNIVWVSLITSNMLYFHLLRPLLFSLPEEHAHHAAIWALKHRLIPAPACTFSHTLLQQTLWGLAFSHPLGLAAGFDKNAEAVHALFRQGFSFIEAGTVTPLPQPGNPKPRLFRLTQDDALVNRLGFNSKGADYFARRMKKPRDGTGILGINIGKNKTTNEAARDYVALIEKFYEFGDYITINISSPNTPGLRDLQRKQALRDLLGPIMAARAAQFRMREKSVPLLVKIAPDLSAQELENIAETALEMHVDGLIISNTTTGGRALLKSPEAKEIGGLSGRPLFEQSTHALRNMYRLTAGKIPLIGVGGIFSGADAYQKIRAGASLLQIYTALIYHGFGVVPHILNELTALLRKDGFLHISEAIGVDARK